MDELGNRRSEVRDRTNHLPVNTHTSGHLPVPQVCALDLHVLFRRNFPNLHSLFHDSLASSYYYTITTPRSTPEEVSAVGFQPSASFTRTSAFSFVISSSEVMFSSKQH